MSAADFTFINTKFFSCLSETLLARLATTIRGGNLPHILACQLPPLLDELAFLDVGKFSPVQILGDLPQAAGANVGEANALERERTHPNATPCRLPSTGDHGNEKVASAVAPCIKAPTFWQVGRLRGKHRR